MIILIDTVVLGRAAHHSVIFDEVNQQSLIESIAFVIAKPHQKLAESEVKSYMGLLSD